jgi:hypothetical protein
MRHRHDRPVAADTSAEAPKITIRAAVPADVLKVRRPSCAQAKRLPHGAPPEGRVDYGADHDDTCPRVDRSAN